jgi:hypothetical protein
MDRSNDISLADSATLARLGVTHKLGQGYYAYVFGLEAGNVLKITRCRSTQLLWQQESVKGLPKVLEIMQDVQLPSLYASIIGQHKVMGAVLERLFRIEDLPAATARRARAKFRKFQSRYSECVAGIDRDLKGSTQTALLLSEMAYGGDPAFDEVLPALVLLEQLSRSHALSLEFDYPNIMFNKDGELVLADPVAAEGGLLSYEAKKELNAQRAKQKWVTVSLETAELAAPRWITLDKFPTKKGANADAAERLHGDDGYTDIRVVRYRSPAHLNLLYQGLK